jgi:hypothetical protein
MRIIHNTCIHALYFIFVRCILLRYIIRIPLKHTRIATEIFDRQNKITTKISVTIVGMFERYTYALYLTVRYFFPQITSWRITSSRLFANAEEMNSNPWLQRPSYRAGYCTGKPLGDARFQSKLDTIYSEWYSPLFSSSPSGKNFGILLRLPQHSFLPYL